MASILTGNKINGADIADCADSDVFAALIPSVPVLQAKRFFRSLTAYFGKHKVPILYMKDI